MNTFITRALFVFQIVMTNRFFFFLGKISNWIKFLFSLSLSLSCELILKEILEKEKTVVYDHKVDSRLS